VAKHKRHFTLYIGVFQACAAILYNTSHAVGFNIFLSSLQWHFINDVLALTFVCCLLIHCMGNKSENLNITLRYIAFTCAWVFKERDQWDSVLWEGGLVAFYVLAAIYGMFILNPHLMKLWNIEAMKTGGVLAFAALMLLALQYNPSITPVITGLMHICAGGASYFFWKAVPVLDKKTDLLLPTDGSRFI